MQKLSKISTEKNLSKPKLIVFGELFTDISDTNNHKVLRLKFIVLKQLFCTLTKFQYIAVVVAICYKN